MFSPDQLKLFAHRMVTLIIGQDNRINNVHETGYLWGLSKGGDLAVLICRATHKDQREIAPPPLQSAPVQPQAPSVPPGPYALSGHPMPSSGTAGGQQPPPSTTAAQARPAVLAQVSITRFHIKIFPIIAVLSLDILAPIEGIFEAATEFSKGARGVRSFDMRLDNPAHGLHSVLYADGITEYEPFDDQVKWYIDKLLTKLGLCEPVEELKYLDPEESNAVPKEAQGTSEQALAAPPAASVGSRLEVAEPKAPEAPKTRVPSVPTVPPAPPTLA